MISALPDLRDGRLALREWTVEDVESLVKACNDPKLLGQLGVPAPYTEKDAEQYVSLCAAGWAKRRQFTFAVTEQTTGKIVGSVRVVPSPHGATAGYWTAPWARRRHVASDALRLVTTWAGDNGLLPIRLYIDPENFGSQRAASNAGYKYDPESAILDPEGVSGDMVFITP